MNSFKVALIFAVLAIAMIAQVQSIRCYNCAEDSEGGKLNGKCDHPDGTTGILDESKGCKYCAKLDLAKGGATLVTRFCYTTSSLKAEAKNKCAFGEYNGVSGKICTCDSDLCNGVEGKGMNQFLVGTVSAFMMLMVFFNKN